VNQQVKYPQGKANRSVRTVYWKGKAANNSWQCRRRQRRRKRHWQTLKDHDGSWSFVYLLTHLSTLLFKQHVAKVSMGLQ